MSGIIEPCYIEFGKWVREQREKHGLSQQDIADVIGLQRTSICNIEVGRQRILWHDVLAFQEIFTDGKTSGLIANARLAREAAKDDAILAEAEQIRTKRAALTSTAANQGEGK